MFPLTNWDLDDCPLEQTKAARMEEQHSGISIAVTHSLERAALLPHRRDELISHALEQLLTSISAVGTALIWPRRDRAVPWKVYYAGINRTAMHRWLSARLDPSLAVIIGVLQHELISSFSDMPLPLFIPLQPSPMSPPGLWIVWAVRPSASPLPDSVSKYIERVRQTLEAVLEVEEREAHFFTSSSPLYDRNLIEALAHGDPQALSTFLSLTRVFAAADFTFWGRAYQDVVEVTDHLGARDGGFGFALPRGHGVGGRVIAYGESIVLTDYRNSPYRHSSVSDIVDAEEIRTGLAVPVRAAADLEQQGPVAAVLYATRRTVTPFSLAERLLVQRQASLLGSLSFEARPASFFSPGVQQLPDYKARWHDLVLHADRIEVVEAWASQIIKGVVIVTDSEQRPYVLTNSEQLEQICASRSSQPDAVQVLSLAVPGVRLPGHVYLCPSIALPPARWPDFFADLVVACNAVIKRMERAHDQWDRQRERWVRALLKEGILQPFVEQEGHRLGLPVDQGQLWVLAWFPGTMQVTTSVRKHMIAENVVLDQVKSPLIFFDDDMAVILLEGQVPRNPSRVRDALLAHCGAHPLWIVQGGHYRSLHDLKTTLAHSLSLARKARRDNYAEYLLDTSAFGLDSLLENPRLAEDLDTFARRLLTPLLEYDAANSSHLTDTFVLAQTLGSAQAVAEQLGVHVNTIRYRLRRAEDLLGTDRTSPKEHAALVLAAFTWQRFHTAEQALS
jgi:sugar diacid utilization regulator